MERYRAKYDDLDLLDALAWPDPEMPVTVEDGHVKFLAVNQETGF